MKTNYPIERVPATPEYILACIREEWRQTVLSDEDDPANVERQLPTFGTTIHEWREALNLLGRRALGRALNECWGTKFSEWRWFSVLVPTRTPGRTTQTLNLRRFLLNRKNIRQVEGDRGSSGENNTPAANWAMHYENKN